MSIETIKATAPDYWASYLVNGDDSGLSNQDVRDADAFMESLGVSHASDCGESYFSHTCDADTLPGDVCEYTFHKVQS